MSDDKKRTCGKCQSAVRSNVRGMEETLWCQSGHAARRAGVGSIQSAFLNPNREACVDGFVRRTTPIPDAPVVPSHPEKPAEVHTESHQANDAIAPWDIPEPNRTEGPAQSAKPLKDEKPNSDFFL